MVHSAMSSVRSKREAARPTDIADEAWGEKPAPIHERNVWRVLVDLVLSHDEQARPIATELDPVMQRWHDAKQSITAGQLAAATLRVVRGVLEAGEVQVDERACAVEIAPRVVCAHRESEHRDGRCEGCLADLGADYPHPFVDDPDYRFPDCAVLLGDDHRFHLMEDCAFESGARASGRGVPDDAAPRDSTVYQAIELGYRRCRSCVGNDYEGAPRAIRGKLGSVRDLPIRLS